MSQRRSSSVSNNNNNDDGDAFFNRANNRLNHLEVDFMSKLFPGNQSRPREPSYIPKPKNYGSSSSDANHQPNQRPVRSSSASVVVSARGRSGSMPPSNTNANQHHLQQKTHNVVVRRSSSAGIYQQQQPRNDDESETHFQRLRNAALTRTDHQQPQQNQKQQQQQQVQQRGRSSSISRSAVIPVSSSSNQRRGSLVVDNNQNFTSPSTASTSDIILSAQPATMFPISKIRKTTTSSTRKNNNNNNNNNTAERASSRARSPFFVEGDIHSGKTYKRVPSPDHNIRKEDNNDGNNQLQQQQHNIMNLSEIQNHQQQQQRFQDEQEDENLPLDTQRSTVAASDHNNNNNNNNNNLFSNERIHSPRDAHDSAFITPRAKIIIPEKDIPKHYAHIHNLREVNETKLARCLRSGWSFQNKNNNNSNNNDNNNYESFTSSPPKQTKFLFDDESIHLPQNHQEETIVNEAISNEEQWRRKFQEENNNNNKKGIYSRLSTSVPAQIPASGVVMQCFLEEPPAPTFSVAGGRKTTRSQLNFIVHHNSNNNSNAAAARNNKLFQLQQQQQQEYSQINNNNNVSSVSATTTTTTKNPRKSVTIVEENHNNNKNNKQVASPSAVNTSIQGEGKSRIFYAAVDDDHISIAISPRGSVQNSRSNSVVNQQQQVPNTINNEDTNNHRETDSPPSTILSSPRYDNIDTEDLLSTSFLNAIRNTTNSNSHNANNNNPQHAHYSIASSGMTANDRSVVELYSNHRSLLAATETILHVTTSEFCDMYRHSFCSKEADRFTVPGHHKNINNNRKNFRSASANHENNNNNNRLQQPQQQKQQLQHENNQSETRQLHQTLIHFGVAPNTEQRLTRRPIDPDCETDDVATDLLSPLGKSENGESMQNRGCSRSSRNANKNSSNNHTEEGKNDDDGDDLLLVSPDKDQINNNSSNNNPHHDDDDDDDDPPQSSPLISDFPSTGKRGRHSSPVSDLYASPIVVDNTTSKNGKGKQNHDNIINDNPFSHHGFAIVHPQPEDLQEANDPSSMNDISYYVPPNNSASHTNDDSNVLENNDSSNHHSPLLRRLKELHNIPPHRYSVLTVVWCSLWCASVALDLPCIASYRRYTHDIVLPRRPSLKELQSEFFGGIAVSDASNRQMLHHPKECTVASKILSATKDFGLELVAVAAEYAHREARAQLNKYDANKNAEGNTTNAASAFFTRRSQTARLDAALQHSIRWIVEAAGIEEEERKWNEENNVVVVELSPESEEKKKSATPEPDRSENLPVPTPQQERNKNNNNSKLNNGNEFTSEEETPIPSSNVPQPTAAANAAPINKSTKNKPINKNISSISSLDHALDLICVKNENVDLHSVTIAKALLRWSWLLRESCLGVLEEEH